MRQTSTVPLSVAVVVGFAFRGPWLLVEMSNMAVFIAPIKQAG